MKTMLVVVAVVVFLAVIAVAGFLYWSVRSQEEARARALAHRLGTNQEPPPSDAFHLQGRDTVATALGGTGDRLEMLLLEAGSPYPFSALVARVGGAAITGAVMMTALLRSPIGLIGVLAGAIPVVMLSSAATTRARRLSEQLPDALDLVARSLQAGHGFSDAMKLCSEEMPAPVRDEFGRVFEENNLGRDMRECLNALSARNTRNFDLKLFVSSVLLQRDTGGNLIEILNTIARTVRDRFVFEAKVRAMTAEARISSIILGGLPFALLCLIGLTRPEYLSPMGTDPLGQKIAMAGALWFTTGIFVMRAVSKVEV
jgi:tight adherence protein B